MRISPAMIERTPQTGLFVDIIPNFIGAHSQGKANHTSHDVIAMLPEDRKPLLESGFGGVQNIVIA